MERTVEDACPYRFVLCATSSANATFAVILSGREAPAGNLRRFFNCSRFQSPEGGGYRETDNLRVGVGAHDDPETIACCERPFVRHLERSEAESKFAKWSVRNGANRANRVSERSKNDYR